MNKIPRLRTEWLRPIGMTLISFLAPALPVLAEVIVIEPPAEAPPSHFYIYEGESVFFKWSTFGAVDGKIVDAPLFLDLEVTGGGFKISSTEKRSGRERVLIEPWSDTGAMAPIPLDIWVYPHVFPVSGRFDGGKRTVGLFDAKNGLFQLCRAQPGHELDCSYFPVLDDQREVRLPIAWPRGELDVPALFSPEKGTFFVYDIQTDGTLKLEQTFEMQEAVATWPVWGAFGPDGDWQLVLVHADGKVIAHSDGNTEEWTEKLTVPERGMLVWPAPWTIEHGSVHALGLFQPVDGHLHWSARQPDGSIQAGYVHSTDSGDFARPVLLDAGSIGRVAGQIYFLRRLGNEFELWPFKTDGRPNVIPIKFPDDPPGGGGSGGGQSPE